MSDFWMWLLKDLAVIILIDTVVIGVIVSVWKKGDERHK